MPLSIDIHEIFSAIPNNVPGMNLKVKNLGDFNYDMNNTVMIVKFSITCGDFMEQLQY